MDEILKSSLEYDWEFCTKQFLNNLIPGNEDYSNIS